MELVAANVSAGTAWAGSAAEVPAVGDAEADGESVASWGPRPNLIRARESGVSLVCQP